ncbi:MAG: AMIN domain-containing protein, partial [Thermodesulfobacteriota bacterium]
MNTTRIALSLYSLFLLFSFYQDSPANEEAEIQFRETLELYKSLSTDPVKVQDQEIWDIIARAFYSIYLNNPDSSKAPNSLFLSGKMYEEIGNKFESREDLEKSVDRSRLFIRAYPDNSLADDAQIRIARIIEGWDKKQSYLEYEKVIEDFPSGDMKIAAKNKVQELSPFKPSTEERARARVNEKSEGLVNIKNIQHWSTDNYSRVVIHLDKEMPYQSYLLKADQSSRKPPRLYVDIMGTTVDKTLQVPPIEDGLLEDIKFGRNTMDRVRVVLYIKRFVNYRVFSLNEPFRIVIDIEGKKLESDDY